MKTFRQNEESKDIKAPSRDETPFSEDETEIPNKKELYQSENALYP